MNEGARSPNERDFRTLVYRNRALLYESAMKMLKTFLGPQWSYRLEEEAQRGLLAVKSPLMYVIKNEYEIPLTMNTRGNQLRILLLDGKTFSDFDLMAKELERIVKSGRAPTRQEVTKLRAERREDINRRRGLRRAKDKTDELSEPTLPVIEQNESQIEEQVPTESEIVPPPTRSSSAAQTQPRTLRSIHETYLQHDYEAAMRIFGSDGIQATPLADDPRVRVRRYSVLSRVQGVFRRINDHISVKSGGGHDNIKRFVATVHGKVANGTILSLEQYEALCSLVKMLHSEVMATNPPNIVQSDFDRLVKEVEVF